QQPGDRVRDVQIARDRRDQRPDPDDLRPQRESGEEQSREEAEALLHYAAATGFVSAPSPSTSMVISSPGCMNTGGSRKTPTPAGVARALMSSGSCVSVCMMGARKLD